MEVNNEKLFMPHKIYEKHPIIFKKKYALIPLIDKRQKRVGYVKVDLDDVDMLSEFSYHINNDGYAISNKLVTMQELVIGKKAGKG